MKAFSYYKATSVEQALALLSKHQQNAAILAGGSDLLGMMKDGIEGPKLKSPAFLIDIKGIRELAYVREAKDGLRIGAGTTITDIVSSDVVARKYPLLHQAASQVGVPQIRNVGTLGGNLCQKSRCWYFRGAAFQDCYRKGGNQCYGAVGENRYHAVFGGSRCFMAHPSDLAPALIALGASVEIASPRGMRSVPIEKFYVGPDRNVMSETILTPQEMLVAVSVPAPIATSKAAYLKLKQRESFDFALVSVAVNLSLKNGVVEQARIAFGGLAPFPMRSAGTEAALQGKAVSAAIGSACKACTAGAQPLNQNAYKVQAAAGILEEALTRMA
jgi:xanthine dehydrogenase YagS FAD-binding subunit